MTENGWPPDTNKVVAIGLTDCEYVTIPGTSEKLWFQKGIPAILLPAFMADLNEFVESVNNSRGYTDEGSWTNGNSVKSSNHNGASAFDYNWADHPMGIKLDGWHGSDIIDGEEEPEIRKILAYYTFGGVQMVYWGNDWDSPHDSMHFQCGYGTYENQLNCWNFINTHIRADGFSTYRRGGTARGGQVVVPDAPSANITQLLADAMGNVTGVDYAVLAPYVSVALQASECNTNNRIAMWCAEIGHESVGLRYMKEIWGPTAAQLTYQGRMGNTNPGDGERYMGRGPIQITGKDNYRTLSKWAYAKGFVSSPTYFVDNPEELENYTYAFLGAVWYWTVARSDINSLCDAGDVETVSKRINGTNPQTGRANGIDDRIARWNHCRAMDLTPLEMGEDWMANVDTDRLNEAVNKILGGGGTAPEKWPSRSMFAPDGNGIDDTVGMLLNVDGNAWNLLVIVGALLGVEEDVATVTRCASGEFDDQSYVWTDDWLAARATEFAQKLLPLCGMLKAPVPQDKS